MKRERKFRLLAFILPVLMLIQAFFLAPAGLAEGETTYTIHLDFSIKDTTVKESSRRQVKLWKIPENKLEKDQAGKVDRLSMAKKYDGMKEEDIIKDLGEEVLTSKESKINENGDKERISLQIEQEENEELYYLIKESEESFAKMKDRIDSGKYSKLTTTVLKVPNDEFKNNELLINLKDSPKTTDLKLIKVDAHDHNIKLDKVQFKLFKRVKDTDSEKSSSEERFKYIPIEVEGSLGTYKFKAEIEDEKLATVLQTNTDGEITVSGLDENSYYVFKEVKAIEGYDKTLNEGIISEAKKPGEGDIIFENKRIPSLIKVKKGTTETLDGVKFAVYKKDGEDKLKFREGKIPGEYIYDEAGDLTDIETKSGGKIYLRELPAGDYYFKEISTIEGYIKSEDSYEFSVDENHNIKVNGELKSVMVENVPENEDNPTPPGENPKGSHSFIKVDKDDHGKKLAGAKFKVQKLVDDKYMTVVRNGSEYIVESDANGALEVTDLEYGHYRLKEVGFPENYNPVDEFTEFDISATSSLNTPVLIENAHKPPKEETPPPTPPTPPETPSTPTKTLTSRSRGPLVKTGDIRIWIYFAIGLLMIVAGFVIIRNQDKKQELA